MPYHSHEFNDSSKEFYVIELSSSHSQLVQKSIPDAVFPEWISSAAGQPLTLTPVRFLDLTPWPYNIRKQNFDLVLKSFRLGRAYQYYNNADTSVAKSPNPQEGRDEIYNYSVFRLDLAVLLWSYDSKRDTTQALCLGDRSIISSVLSLLGYQIPLIGRPMTLGYNFATVLVNLLDSDLLLEIKP